MSPRDDVSSRGCFSTGPRLILALVIVAVSVISYCSTKEYNPVTGETQHIGISKETEVALGLQAAPEMAAQYGGEAPDPKQQALVDRVGSAVVANSKAGTSEYPFKFHLLADPRTINAFALPGGQVFITRGLLDKLETEGQLAGVLGHEIGHVVGRHSAEHIAKQQLEQGLTGAAVLATYDPNRRSTYQTAAFIALIGGLVNMKFGRSDELEADKFGVQYSSEAGYDPRAMLGVMRVLEKASEGRAPPEFFSTHPNPEHRVEHIAEEIKALYPNGVPEGLKP